MIVHVVKTRAGGPTTRLLAGCRAAGPLFGWYFGFDTILITLDFFFGPSDLTPPLNGAQVEKKGRSDSSDDYFISNQAD